MILQTVPSPGLAHYSYVFGDEKAGVCAVVDPRRDVDIYLEIARQNKSRIAYILETHIHADFVSGSRELAARTGAPIGVGATGEYGFEHHALADGQRIELGDFTLEVLHTPGHTPEHIIFLVSGGAGAAAPWGLFTGDTLFAGEVGRPDLLGEDQEEGLARQLFDSLHEQILPLGDEIIIYPAHGQGSPCGASIGVRPTSTVGYERRNNSLLQIKSKEEFVRQVLDSLSPAPSYYPRMKRINAQGAPLLGALPFLPALEVEAFAQEMEKPNAIVLDVRAIEAYGGAHIPGALNIGLREPFPIWAGRILDETLAIWAGRVLEPESHILLVLPDEESAEVVRTELLRVGHPEVAGYLRQGMQGWTEAGKSFERVGQVTVHELKEHVDAEDEWQILDVRSPGEWQKEHIPGARHIYVADLTKKLGSLDRGRPVVTYCGSGYRASIAASILRRQGFDEVYNVPGSISAWQAAGYPLVTP